VTLTDLSFNVATGFNPVGQITVEAQAGSLFPGASGFTAEVSSSSALPGFRGNYDLADGSITLVVGQLDVSLGDELMLHAEDVTLTPSQQTVATIPQASLSLAVLGEVTATVDNVRIDRSGAFGLGTATFSSPTGLLESIGLGAIVPLDLNEVVVSFNDTDGDGLLMGAELLPSLEAKGTIRADFFAQSGNDGFDPFVIVGDLPVDDRGNTDPSDDIITVVDIVDFLSSVPVASVIDSVENAPTAATKAMPGVTQFQFGVAIVDGLIVPFEIPNIALGFTELDLGVVEASGFISLGAYADRQAVLDGNAAFTVDFAGGIAVTSTVEGSMGMR